MQMFTVFGPKYPLGGTSLCLFLGAYHEKQEPRSQIAAVSLPCK